MSDTQKASLLASTQSDHSPDFEALIDPYRHELLVHCYRMLGSLEDAEDALQEALLRAWRHFDSLKSQAALRAWLYKIATNVSLNMLASRRVRSMPTAADSPANPQAPLQAPILDPVWFDPLPDEYISGESPSPESRYETKESVSLAFLMALQRLPGRQRAILILRDVLGWKAEEIASLLDLSLPAANSALQRARATMKKQHQGEHGRVAADDERVAALLARYVRAWEASDSASLVALLREDAILTMPPLPGWFRGRAAIRDFLDVHIFSATRPGQQQFRTLATRANGCPAFASYQQDEAGVYRPGAILILTLDGHQIAQIDDFLALDPRLFLRFNLPLSL